MKNSVKLVSLFISAMALTSLCLATDEVPGTTKGRSTALFGLGAVGVTGGISATMRMGDQFKAAAGHDGVAIQDLLLFQREAQVDQLYVTTFPGSQGQPENPSVLAQNGGGCGINLSVLPESLRQLLLNECVAEVTQTQPGSKSYCECVQKRFARYAQGDAKTALEAKRSAMKTRIEELVMGQLLSEWRDSFRRVAMAQAQAVRIVPEERRQAFLPAASCSPEAILANVTAAREQPGCNKQNFDRYVNAANNRLNIFARFNSITTNIAAGMPAASNMDGLRSLMRINSGRSLASGQRDTDANNRDNETLNCFPNGEDRVLGSMGLVIGGGRNNVGQTTAMLDQMITALEKRIALLGDDKRDLSTDFDLDEIMHREAKPEDEGFVRAISNFPTLGFLLKGLSNQTVVGADGKSLEPASDDVMSARRGEMKTQLEALLKTYKNIRSGLKDAGMQPLDRVKLAYAELSKFNTKLKEPLARVSVPEYQMLASVHCGQMTKDLIRITCAPVIPTGEIGFVDAALGQARGADKTPSPSECRNNATDENREACLLMQSVTCSGADKAKDEKVNLFASLETMTNYESRNNTREGNYTSLGYSMGQLRENLCGDYSKWVRDEVCKGQNLDTCQYSDAASVERYTAAHPDSALGGIIDASNEAARNGYSGGGSDDMLASVTRDFGTRDDSTNTIVEGMRQAIGNGPTVASADGVATSSSGFGELFKNVGQDIAAGISGTMGGTTARNNIITTPVPFLPSEGFRQQVAAKDEEISDKKKEEELLERRISTSTDSAQKSALQAQLDELQKDLARLRSERDQLERDRIAAKEKEDEESATVADAGGQGESKKVRRDPASVSAGGGNSSFVSSTGGSAGGNTAGAVTNGAGSVTGISDGGLGSSTGGARFSTVQQVVSAPASQALLEANQLKLTVNGSEVPAQDVTTLQVPAGATPDVIRRLIEENKDKLKFVNNLAMVELIGPGNKPVYYQVKKQGESFELVAVKENIPQQVRGWTASYQNFMQRLRQSTTRGPASPTK